MKAVRLGFITSSSLYVAVIASLGIAVSAFAAGGSMYSPGALNAQVGNMLGGVSSHAEIAGDCKACHTAPWETATMDDRCSACHVDVADELLDPASPHGRMMQIDPQAKCMTCHPEHNGRDALLTVIEGWQFPHEVSRFKLNGHQLTAANEPFLCADCHGEDVTQFNPLTCLECHIRMDMAFMVEHQFTFGENCLECHDGVDRFGDDFDHNKFAFKLTGRHIPVKCSQCHAGGTTISALQSTPQNCFSCHAKDDVHNGSLGPDCVACHSPDGWSPSTFDHNLSVFKLTGAHAQVACATCHLNGVFKGTPQDCFTCHQQDDAHMGQLGTTCASCHTTDAWKPAQFDHNTTAFQLTGSHVNVECKACHINGIYKNTPKDCFSCHASNDVHKGEYGRNCAACHQTTTWAGAKFDHNTTAFPLIGNHVKVKCKSCHTSDVFKGTPKDCIACHARNDVHNGQLGANCSLCHRPTGWKPITFDHNFTAFPLTGAHTSLACTQCHMSGRFKIATECASCHTEPAFHSGAFGTNCAQCHTTTAWSEANFVGTHPVALGQNFLDHHGATCRTCHVTTVHTFTCLTCHETNPLSPDDATGTPAADAPRVLTSLDSSTIDVGETSQLSVQLNNVPAQGYASTEFICTYDPALVEVGNISVGSLFGTDTVSGISGPQNGSLIVAVAGSKGQKATGSGVAFTFSATAKQAGSTNIECQARVSEGLNALQSIESQPSTLTIAMPTPTAVNESTQATISGQVLASKIVTVRLYNADNTIAATTTSNPDGTFSLSAPQGTYTIAASADGFLSTQGSLTLTAGNTLSQPPVSLIAGDIDGNGVIDAMDALTIRMNYNLNVPAAADLNNDGEINVLDLGILAENYGKSAPIPWP